MLLPLFSIAAVAFAAVIGWHIARRLLVRPLVALRREVATYRPGKILSPPATTMSAAQEIAELSEAFHALSRDVARHEQEMQRALADQTRLTREVHHRVKNNLQIISSLISLHWRATEDPNTAAAYLSIQRRVDALAVVHRNNFAELEENRGLSLRSVIGDLASNFRATAPPANGLSISLDLDSCLSTQDVAAAIAFLLTEIVELAMTCQPDAALRLSLKPTGDDDGKAILRVSSPALIGGDLLEAELAERYGRVMEGLSRQLRSKLHHDPLVGAYEILIAITGCD